MTEAQQKMYMELKSSITETSDDKALYRTIANALITSSGYGTKPKALKEKADELFHAIKNKPYQY